MQEKFIPLRYGNCLVWSLLQRIAVGGKLVHIPSQYCREYLPHIMLEKDGITWSYSPRAWFGDGQGIDTPVFFEGVVIRYRKPPKND